MFITVGKSSSAHRLEGDTPPRGGVSPLSGVWEVERGGGRGESPTHHSGGKKSPLSGVWAVEAYDSTRQAAQGRQTHLVLS